MIISQLLHTKDKGVEIPDVAAERGIVSIHSVQAWQPLVLTGRNRTGIRFARDTSRQLRDVSKCRSPRHCVALTELREVAGVEIETARWVFAVASISAETLQAIVTVLTKPDIGRRPDRESSNAARGCHIGI